jgi:hypothetical protein
MTFGL